MPSFFAEPPSEPVAQLTLATRLPLGVVPAVCVSGRLLDRAEIEVDAGTVTLLSAVQPDDIIAVGYSMPTITPPADQGEAPPFRLAPPSRRVPLGPVASRVVQL